MHASMLANEIIPDLFVCSNRRNTHRQRCADKHAERQDKPFVDTKTYANTQADTDPDFNSDAETNHKNKLDFDLGSGRTRRAFVSGKRDLRTYHPRRDICATGKG